MRISKPSPAMIVATVAVVMASSGTAVAAVSYARNAGAVDRVSATRANTTPARAAGKLVATARGGSLKGQIPPQFLGGVVKGTGDVRSFTSRVSVIDNGTAAPVDTIAFPGIGRVRVGCTDQNKTAGREDPQTTITLVNESGQPVDVARTIGANQPAVVGLQNGQQLGAPLDGSTTIELLVQRAGTSVDFRAGVRQDGANTADASCYVFGSAGQIG